MPFEAYPMRFIPTYKDYVWGGGRIPELLGREPRDGTSAESWEISDRPEGMSVVANGTYHGKTLGQIMGRSPAAVVGSSRGAHQQRFPLLVKIIDAGSRLSVQVHPDDSSAARYGGEPKSEMWYALLAGSNSSVFAGLKEPSRPDAFASAIETNSVENLLRPLPMRPGYSLFVPGGRVHAVCENNLLLEVQQNSNTTYRVYDWGRTDTNGKPRALHIREALQVINWNDTGSEPSEQRLEQESHGNRFWSLMRCAFFDVLAVDLDSRLTLRNDGATFHAFFVERGAVSVESGACNEIMNAGNSFLIPASLRRYSIVPGEHGSRLIRVSLPVTSRKEWDPDPAHGA